MTATTTAMNMISRTLLATTMFLLLAPAAQGQIKKQKQTKAVTSASQKTEKLSALITVDELAALSSENEDIRILELSTLRSEFDKGHLPGAQFVHWVDDITDPQESERYNILKSGEAELFMRLGISNDTHVILYDRMQSRVSTRMFWMMKIFKHEKVQVLDGGFALWSKTNTPTKKVAEFPRGSYQIDSKNEDLIADLEYVKQRIKDKETTMIDGRPPKQFSGEEAGKVFHTKVAHKRRGHVPGAVNITWKDNFNEDGTFKSADQLRKLYSAKGALESKEVITYCNEGLHAAPPWFVLTQILGRSDVRLYDDSMAEWANSTEPMTNPAPEKKSK